ncbi:MAG: hypothetical protein PIR02_12275 [Microbacterium enclense]
MRETVLWAVAAVLALLWVPVLYAIAMFYGVETPVWDPYYSTYTYEERPGGFAVVVASLSLCAGLVLFSLISAGITVTRLARADVRLRNPSSARRTS